MVKYICYSIFFTLSLYADININVSSLHQIDKYMIEDGDTLFSGDGIKFHFITNKVESLEIIYKNDKVLFSQKLDANKLYDFPTDKDSWLILDDQVGDEEFTFRINNTNIKTFNFTHISQKSHTPDYNISNKRITSELLQNQSYNFQNIEQRISHNLENLKSNTRGEKEIKIFKTLSQPVVIIKAEENIGTGILISNKGEILTSWHVVKDTDNILVAFKPRIGNRPAKNNYHTAQITKLDIEKDLALLQLVDRTVVHSKQPIKFANIDTVQVGEDIFTIGHPLGELWTFSTGLVSQIRNNFTWNTNGIKHQATYVIQTQNAISRGNSGGPLVNKKVELLGLNTLSNNQGQNLNYAVSIKDIKDFLTQPKKPNNHMQMQSTFSKDFKSLHIVKSKKGVDTHGNKLLQVYVDSDANGNIDLSLIDIGRDGSWNIIYKDQNENRIYEEVKFDKNQNEIIELVYIDKDEDGKWDLIGYDKNEDRIFEKWSNF